MVVNVKLELLHLCPDIDFNQIEKNYILITLFVKCIEIDAETTPSSIRFHTILMCDGV